jgi:hypothetical protein
MRYCFFGGAVHAVLSLQKAHGEQLAAGIASFLVEEAQSRHPKPFACAIDLVVGNSGTLATPRVESDEILGADQREIDATQPI